MSWFAEHTIESAPPGSRRFMAATQEQLGYLPAAMARWAASPQLLEGFGRMTGAVRPLHAGPGGPRGGDHDGRDPERL